MSQGGMGELDHRHDPTPQNLRVWRTALLAGDARYRVGGKLARTLYLQLGATPAESDLILGMCDYGAFARYVVAVLNGDITAQDRPI